MELTQIEIQKVLAFLDKKRVKHIDVQHELLDHVASRIEEIQSNDSSITFDAALHQVYKSFGIYGFTKVAENKSLELQKYWQKKMARYFLRYFELPRILMTAGLTGLIYFSLLQLQEIIPQLTITNNNFILISNLGLVIFTIGTTIYIQKKYGRLNSNYLSIQSFNIARLGVLGVCFQSIYWFMWMPFTGVTYDSPWLLLLVSLGFAFTIITAHAFYFTFNRWFEEELEVTYQRYGASISG